jgi:hypothetical protein
MIRRQPLLAASPFVCATLAAGAACLAGCGSGPAPLGPRDGGVETSTGSDAPVASQTPIGPAGGMVTGPPGAEVTVPAGALAAPTTIKVVRADVPDNEAGWRPAIPKRFEVDHHQIFGFLPHGTTFAAPVTIHVPIGQTLVARAAGKPLKLFTAEREGTWAEVPNARVGATSVEAEVMHFSFFVVGFEIPEQTLPAVPSGKLDMLFMVDNSASMRPLQEKLVASFPALIRTLKTLPGDLPDLHLGVVSSSLGAGPHDSPDIPQCPLGGDAGRLQWMPRGGCVDRGPTDHFIAAGAAESTKNYPGTIEEAFTCIAALGDAGCGFEHSLESMAVALGVRGGVPPENAGFLRPDAALALVVITNEDDCSAPPDASELFSPASRYVSEPMGPLSSYRCNEFGHLCAGNRPPRTLGATMTTLADCRSAEDGVLFRVADYAKAFKALKPDPSQVHLAVIAGPPTPYTVQFTTPTLAGDPSPWPAVAHSCMSATGEFADPPVRLAELVTAFGANGSLSSICDDLAPALTSIGAAVGKTMGPRCLQADVVAVGATPKLAAGCGVFESVPAAGGVRTETPLPACAPGATGPCWTVKANAVCAPAGAELAITRAGTAPEGAILVVRCSP